MLTLVGGAEGRGEVEVGTKRGGWERGASARALTPRVLVSTIQRPMDPLITSFTHRNNTPGAYAHV